MISNTLVDTIQRRLHEVFRAVPPDLPASLAAAKEATHKLQPHIATAWLRTLVNR